ncbi:DNA damage checkpoint control protein Rad17p [[Candida] anglica]|uniref:DNA damage checkpoint control protein Rad17p n=1 Tax=[Candida] anglica TaxID=148631 RepID=A0ABP0EF10_9ASCO
MSLFETLTGPGIHPVSESSSKPTFTFTAATRQISHLADVFQAVSSINNQALMMISPRGISIYSESNHVMNAHSTIDPSLFSTYNFYSEDTCNNTQDSHPISEELRFGIDLKLISDSFNSVPTPNVGTTIIRKKRSSSNRNNSNIGNHPDDEEEEESPGGGGDGSISGDVTCYITYNGDGTPLIIEFEDAFISEKIEFLTFYTDLKSPYDDENMDDVDEDVNVGLTINREEVEFDLILKSDVLANLLKDLQQIATVDLYMYVSNEISTLGESKKRKKSRNKQQSSPRRGPQFIRNEVNFISKGPIGHSKLIFPNEKTILEKISVYEQGLQTDEGRSTTTMIPANKAIVACYNFANFNKIFRSVRLSSKCKISKDLSGTLSVQLLCKNSRLPGYSGTLIMFNMLGLSSISENYALEHYKEEQVEKTKDEPLTINNIFDDEAYEYRSNSTTMVSEDISTGLIDEYEVLGGNDSTSEPMVQVDTTITASERRGRDMENIEERGALVEIPLFL